MTTVLCFPRDALPPLPIEGVWAAPLDWLGAGLWQPRDHAETDESCLQAIVYLVLQDAFRNVWCYRRRGGDQRVNGRMSLGIGGHVDRIDGDPSGDTLTTLRSALDRELAEELGDSPSGAITEVDQLPRALIYEGHSAIGRVHLGFLYLARWTLDAPPQPTAAESLEGLGFLPLSSIASDSRFELWSQLAAQWLTKQP